MPDSTKRILTDETGQDIVSALEALTNVMTTVSLTDVANAVTDWLDDNIPTGQTVAVDQSLTVSGAAADAKKTGDHLSDLKSALDIINGEEEYLKGTFINGNSDQGVINTNYKYRIVSSSIIAYNRAITLNAKTGFYAVIDLFTNNVFTETKLMYSSVRTLTLPANQQFMITIKRATEDTSEIANIGEFLLGVLVVPSYRDDINDIMPVKQQVVNSGILYDGCTLFPGKSAGQSGGIIDATNYTLWFPKIEYPTGTKLQLSDYDEYRMYIHLWSGSIKSATHTAVSWLQQEYTLDNKYYVAVVLSHINGSLAPISESEALNIFNVLLPNEKQKGLSERIGINTKSIGENLELIQAITEKSLKQSSYVKGINHRGYNTEAPQNTLPAFVLSRKKGFTYVETDVRYTSDGVAVLLHDFDINTTAKNADGTDISETIYIADITYTEALNYVFCANMYDQYPTVKIPKFKDFIALCRNIGLHPYIEIKSSAYNASVLVDIVKECGMLRNVTWICFDPGLLGQVKTADPYARLGLLTTDVSETDITRAQALKTDDNNVFISASSGSSANITACYNAGIPMEVYTMNSESSIINADPYISGIASDTLNASNVLYMNIMS